MIRGNAEEELGWNTYDSNLSKSYHTFHRFLLSFYRLHSYIMIRITFFYYSEDKEDTKIKDKRKVIRWKCGGGAGMEYI